MIPIKSIPSKIGNLLPDLSTNLDDIIVATSCIKFAISAE